MKTLIINGSPRMNGDSMALTNELTKHLIGDIHIVNVYYDDIHPCIDCRDCWDNDGCSIEDEMQVVYKLLNEVDNIILTSPLYFSELTGKLLSFASRLQYLYASRCIRKDDHFHLKKKNAALIITGGGDGSTEPAIERANIIFRHMNAELIGTILSLQTNSKPAKVDKVAMDQAYLLALRLNELSNRANTIRRLDLLKKSL